MRDTIMLPRQLDEATFAAGQKLRQSAAFKLLAPETLSDGSIRLRAKAKDNLNFVDHPQVELNPEGDAVIAFFCDCPDYRADHSFCVHCAALIADRPVRLAAEAAPEASDGEKAEAPSVEDSKDSLTLPIYIDEKGQLEEKGDFAIAIAKWIAAFCSPDVEIAFQDKRTVEQEQKCKAIENEIMEGKCDVDDATARFLSELKKLEFMRSKNSKFLSCLRIFMKSNKKENNLHILKPSDMILFLKELLFQLEVGKHKRDDKEHICVDFTLANGEFKEKFSFYVPIKESELLAMGLNDNLSYMDVGLLSFYDFKDEPRREIVAAFCVAFEWEVSNRRAALWDDEAAQCLENYNLGRH